jgi:hypothetical protein
MSALIQLPTKEQAASVTEELRCVPAGIADSSSIFQQMMRHCTTTFVWQVRLASTKGTADSSSTFQQMMQHCTTNSVWQVKNGFNKRHSRHLINVSTNDAALHYKLSVAGQTGNKRPPKA